MSELEQLLWRLRACERMEGFQSLLVNQDLSCLVTYRWGSKYFKSLAALQVWLDRGVDTDAPGNAPQPTANAS
jgi:hypothetical protein